MVSSVLSLERLDKRFGGIHAVNSVTFNVKSDQIVGLIGPNGSGKSTVVNLVSGTFPPTSGEVFLDGQPITGLTEPARVAAGLARTFQTATFFAGFTVFDQLLLGCHTQVKSSPWASVFRSKKSKTDLLEQSRKVEHIIAMTGLSAVAHDLVEEISSAQQRLLMIAMTLVSAPKIVLLDEPAAGMVSSERQELAEIIRKIRDSGVAVIVIEHHMSLIMDVCDHIVVLNQGNMIAQGDPLSIRNNQLVVDAYLGEQA